MRELLDQLLLQVKGAWRFRWYAVGVAWLVALLGWLVVQLLPNQYAAQTQVYVDTDSVLAPLLKGLAVDRDVENQVGMMQLLMLSQPNLERVARETDLFLDAQSPQEQFKVVAKLQRDIRLEQAPRQNNFTISYVSDDPKRAHSVVQSLLDTFVEDTLGMKRTDVTTAQRFLENQIKEYERRLTESENRLADFKRQNVAVLPGAGGKDYFANLQEAATTLQALEGRYQVLTQRKVELERQLAGEEPTFGLVAGSGAGSDPIDGQIAAIRARRDQLLIVYTDKHPEVQQLDKLIARLEEEKRGGAKVSSSAPVSTGPVTAGDLMLRQMDMNPVYQNMKNQLGATEAEMAEIRGLISNQRAQVNALQAMIDQIPQVEAELARLDRDYNVNKTQYEALVQRLESANISEEAQQTAETVKFRVVEPPVIPLLPSGPNRVALSTIVLLASLAAGLGTALLLAQLRPVFSSRDMLAQLTGLPVLGSVMKLTHERLLPWHRTQAAMVAGAFGALLVAYLLNLLLSENVRETLRGLVG